MTQMHDELLALAARLRDLSQRAEDTGIKEPLVRLEKVAITVGKAWSGSWLGYHATVYYSNLETPPPGAHFSQEWGLMDSFAVQGSTGDWREYDRDKVEQAIYRKAGDPNLESAEQLAGKATQAFEGGKADLLSLLTTAISDHEDSFLNRLRKEAEEADLLTPSDVLRAYRPSGQVMSRDSLAMTQGFRVPPHITVVARIVGLRQAPVACRRLAEIAEKAGSHLARQQNFQKRTKLVGTNVFIGHGRSPVWKDLKDFIQDRLALPWDEFNRVPVAGVTNIARLSEMLDAAAIAFLVMTGEDEQADGNLHARMNVVHEAGLFQGRLGFTRSIVVLEEGCKEFRNCKVIT
jgi:hypothetical protein